MCAIVVKKGIVLEWVSSSLIALCAIVVKKGIVLECVSSRYNKALKLGIHCLHFPSRFQSVHRVFCVCQLYNFAERMQYVLCDAICVDHDQNV